MDPDICQSWGPSLPPRSSSGSGFEDLLSLQLGLLQRASSFNQVPWPLNGLH